ncbi:MAG: hypothetical protein DWI59_06525, partial [Chloroflexi bacterium]
MVSGYRYDSHADNKLDFRHPYLRLEYLCQRFLRSKRFLWSIGQCGAALHCEFPTVEQYSCPHRHLPLHKYGCGTHSAGLCQRRYLPIPGARQPGAGDQRHAAG